MEQVLEVSDRIYMPVRKDKISKAKIEEYEKYLDICGWENLKDKIYKFSVDVLNDSEQEGLDMEEFYQGKFGSMVRTMLKKEDCKFEIQIWKRDDRFYDFMTGKKIGKYREKE